METLLHVMSTSGRPPMPEQCLHRHTAWSVPPTYICNLWLVLGPASPQSSASSVGPVLLWLIFGQSSSSGFGPVSPQFGSSSAHPHLSSAPLRHMQPHLSSASLGPSLTSIQLLLGQASPQFSSSYAQPCLSLAPLQPSLAPFQLLFGSCSLASVWLLFGRASPLFDSLQPHNGSCTPALPQMFAALDRHLLPLTRLLLSCMTLPSSLRL